MEFVDKEKEFPGTVPEYGAIFMSNGKTRKECTRRKLFSLPSSHAEFVKEVKAGMILFLFEYERRELYGVFQACSDGDINIVPHAFSSSGIALPAQVKVIPIWNCSPIPENKFRNAIRENYFSAKKFTFGLSKEQVHRLLSLFSSRKLKDQQLPQRQTSTSKNARRTDEEYCRGKGKGIFIDEDRFTLNEMRIIQEEHEVDNYMPEDIQAQYTRDTLRISKSCGAGKEIFPMEYTVNTRTERYDRSESDYYKYNDLISSTYHYQIGQSIPYPSHSTDCRDVAPVSNAPNTNFRCPSGFNDDYIPIEPHTEDDIESSFSYPLHVQPQFSNHLQSDYGLQRNVQITPPNHFDPSDYSSSSSRMPPQGDASYFPYLVTQSPEIPDRVGYLFSRSLTPVPSPTRNNERESKVPYITPSPYSSFELTYGHPIGLGERRENSMEAKQDNVKTFSSSAPFSIDNPSESPYRTDTVKPGILYPHENQNSGNMYMDCENRVSVFLRLSKPVDESVNPNAYEESSRDVSVAEIMDVLHQNHFHWVGKKESPLLTQHKENVKNLRKKKLTNSLVAEKNSVETCDEEKIISYTDEENESKMDERTPFLDFKRRSQSRKIDCDSKPCSAESPAGDGLLSGEQKRRKLIRPNFSKNEISGCKSVNDNTCLDLRVSSKEIAATSCTDSSGGTGTFVSCHDGENQLSQNMEVIDMKPQVNNEDKGTGGKSEGEEIVDSIGASCRNGSSTGKRSSEYVNTENAAFLTIVREERSTDDNIKVASGDSRKELLGSVENVYSPKSDVLDTAPRSTMDNISSQNSISQKECEEF